MPSSVLIKEKSTQGASSINFSTSKLEDSFLYLSIPSSQNRREHSGLQSDQQQLLPSTVIAQKSVPSTQQAHSSPSSVKTSERLPVSGPYGGKKKTDVRRAPASWGTGGFLSWATTGYQQQQQQQQQSHHPKAEISLDSSHPQSLSVNWNDRSIVLGATDNSYPVDQSFSTSAGALQLLGTIKRLSDFDILSL